VVVDELGLLETRQLLSLLRVQVDTGRQVVAVGDPKQCQSNEAGPVIDLLRRALGAEAVPELLSTVRQQSARERETSLLFREGQAAEASA
jgi:ATP-dependent exoDNAse (exonuclease V) alpha subunit